MKPLSQMSHYEVLDLPRGASAQEVERAYRMAHATYAADSLATYSLFDEKEAAALRERIELAWQVLSDAEARGRYDATLPPEGAVLADVEISIDLEDELGSPAPPPPEVAPEIVGFDDFEDAAEGAWDGARLRRARMRHGVELERIAAVTKISPTYLRFLEDDRFDALPAPVYVRGFVTSYARCLGLDAGRVVGSYMERVKAAQEVRPRPRRRRR